MEPCNDSAYASEIRFGVVMYGGVSLAIYMNGVANELFELACATPKAGVSPPEHEPATRELYRRLSFLSGDCALRDRYAAAIKESPGTDPWEPPPTGAPRSRFVIDSIAGTSAGGINGVFLAKALANGEAFRSLEQIWVEEADLGRLLNDKQSYTEGMSGLRDRSAEPKALLNGDRMYVLLHRALSTMRPLGFKNAAGTDESPLSDELSLWVTTTDLHGTVVQLRLFDKLVPEHRYKQSFRFRYAAGSRNDFAADVQPILAFAARCTSSFPFAFEPMTFANARQLLREPCAAAWQSYMEDLDVAADDKAGDNRAFGDGGYLDNKPFGYVIDSLSRRYTTAPTERKLIYIEPAPEDLGTQPGQLPSAPNALENSWAALAKLPRYETIREDLERLLERNRRIERIERLVSQSELELERSRSKSFSHMQGGEEIPSWNKLKLSDLVAYYGIAFLPYRRLRVESTTDALATRLARRWQIDKNSDYQYALYALVSAWRDRRYTEEGDGGRETVNAYLAAYDLDYRVRRLGFLLRRIDQLIRVLTRWTEPASKQSKLEQQLRKRVEAALTQVPGLSDVERTRAAISALLVLKGHLVAHRKAHVDAADEHHQGSPTPAGAVLEESRALLIKVLKGVLGDEKASKEHALRLPTILRTLHEGVVQRAEALMNSNAKPELIKLLAHVESDVASMAASSKSSANPSSAYVARLPEISAKVKQLLGIYEDNTVPGKRTLSLRETDRELAPNQREQLNSDIGRELRRLLAQYFVNFDSYDQVSYPMYYDTHTGEPTPVDVVRISPIDARGLVNDEETRKLAGTAFGNFGAFLDRSWRRNDMMWGRLDGAERLISALLPNDYDNSAVVRDHLVKLAHRSILQETLGKQGRAEIVSLLANALERAPRADADAAREGASSVAQALSVSREMNKLASRLSQGNGRGRVRLSSILPTLLTEADLIEYVRSKRNIEPKPDPELTLQSSARAVTITGRLLEDISKRELRSASQASLWLARLGLLLQGVLAVSVPGTITGAFWRHWLHLLYAFEAVLLVAAFLLGNADIQMLALTMFGVTAGLHVLSFVVRKLIRPAPIRGYLRVGAAALLLLCAAVGARTLWRDATELARCQTARTRVGVAKLSETVVCTLLTGKREAQR